MPTDLFGGNPQYGVEENPVQSAAAPRDLFGGDANYGASSNVQNDQQNVSSALPENYPFAEDIGRHALAGAASFARDIANIPPSVGRLLGYKGMPAPYKNEDFYKKLGVNEGIGDKLATGLAGFIPFIGPASKLSKAAGLAENLPRLAPYLENAAAAGTQGALMTHSDNPLESGVTAALLSLPGSAIGQAGNALINYGAKKYAQSAIPEFTKAATDKIKSLLPTSDYATQLFSRFKGATKENNANWNAVNDASQQLDSFIGKNFNNQPYHDYIDSHIAKVKGMEPAKREPYTQSLTLAEKAKEIAPESFSGIVAARQNINRNLSDFLDPTGMTKPNRYSTEFMNGLKDSLKNEVLEANREKLAPEAFNNFKSQWEKANQSHQNLQDFNKSLKSTTGVLKPMKSTREMYEAAKGEGGSDPSKWTGDLDSSILNRYMPPLTLKGSQGTKGLTHLGKLFGDKNTAQDAAQATLFRRPTEQGASTIDSAKIYSDMTPPQRQAIFGNSSQGQMLDAINNTRLAFGREPQKTLSKITHGLTSWGAPGLVGFGAGMASGDDWGKSAEIGLGTMLASKGMGKIAGKTATPQSVATAIKLGKVSPFKGRYINPVSQLFNPFSGNNQ